MLFAHPFLNNRTHGINQGNKASRSDLRTNQIAFKHGEGSINTEDFMHADDPAQYHDRIDFVAIMYRYVHKIVAALPRRIHEGDFSPRIPFETRLTQFQSTSKHKVKTNLPS